MIDQTQRAKSFFIVLLLIAVVMAGMVFTKGAAHASPTLLDVKTNSLSFTAMQRRLDWSTHHIHRLQNRNEYLHRYIRHMRRSYQASAPVPTSTSTTTTAPPVATITASSSGGWADELRAVGFPESAIPTMLGYIDRESGGDPSAVNSSSGACGLLQLYPCLGGSAWLDPMTNLRLAYQKYQASGFSPWGG